MSTPDLASLSDEALVSQYAEEKQYADQIYASLEAYKAELQRRFAATGQVEFDSPTAKATMTREPISVAWLERRYGFKAEELPSGCWAEKITKALDVPAVEAWLAEQGMTLDASYSVRLKLKTKA